MVLSNEELSLLHGLITGIQNTSTYGYEVAVKGTVIDGIANLVCGLITIIISLYAAKRFYAWAKKIDEKDHSDDGTWAYGTAFIGVICVLIAAAITCSGIIHDPFMQIFAPEYTVIKQVLAAATKTVT